MSTENLETLSVDENAGASVVKESSSNIMEHREETSNDLLFCDSGPEERHIAIGVTGSDGQEEIEGEEEEGEGNRPESMQLLKNKSSVYLEPAREEYDTKLSEDIYSLMYTGGVKDISFLFAMFVFTFQCTMCLLVFLDLIDFDSDQNPLRIPGGVNLNVRVLQALALTLAVPYQQDLIISLVQLVEGYDRIIMEEKPAATFSKWLLSIVTQMTIGTMLLVTVFVLMVQTEEVLEAMLNYAGLAFISEIDSLAFVMAKKGFLTPAVQSDCEEISRLHIPVKEIPHYFRQVIYITLTGALLAGYGVVVHQQRSGKFLPSSIVVQFADDFRPELSTFSGLYDQVPGDINERVHYLEHRSQRAIFGYCDNDETWSFMYKTDDAESFDPCQGVFRSSPTQSYDILSASDWLVLDEDTGDFYPAVRFYLSGDDCSERCHTENGHCEDNACVCDEGHFGVNCERSYPCESLVVDKRTPPFPRLQFGATPSNIYRLLMIGNSTKAVEVYDRPVYFSETKTGTFDLLFYTGRRWVIAETEFGDAAFTAILETENLNISAPPQSGENLPTYVSLLRNALARYLSDDYHAFYSARFPSLVISEPVDFGTPSDRLTPVGLNWFRINSFSPALKADLQPLGTGLLCAVCNDSSNTCFNRGICSNTTGSCMCRDGFVGALCEEELLCTTDDDCRNDFGVCDETNGRCECSSDRYTGSLCTIPRNCLFIEDACDNGGTCNNSTGECNCPPSTFGGFCEHQYCDIPGITCLNNGECNNVTRVCDCPEGYSGFLCQILPQYCDIDGVNCKNDGVCNNITRKCECPVGYGGALCEVSLQYCDVEGNQCLNGGECNTDTRECECPLGYIGTLCGDSRPCTFEGVSCLNNGTCNEATGECQCATGYGQAYCERECPPGTYGFYCENTFCDLDGVECLFNGVCNTSTRQCECVKGYYGSLCEFSEDCSNEGISCLNGGVCNTTLGKCDCVRGFGLSFCEIECPEGTYGFSCTSQYCDVEGVECFHDGVCDTSSRECICAHWYYGDLCEFARPCTDAEVSCLNDGICNSATRACECAEGFSGSYCEGEL